ncbi:MAG: sigma-70 family RNA polymerase sigma factor [Brevinematales bacterium]|nr:sigma-70 family RNA polymerase sigma factor [Brevinematales bacterium]
MEKEFEKFFNDNQHLLFRIVNGYVKDRELAKDIVVETMYIVYERWHQIVKMKNSVAYAVRIAINRAKKFLLNKKIKNVFFSDMQEDVESSYRLEDETIDKEIFNWINISINELNENERNVILLRDGDNLKFEEIAELLLLNLSTVKTLYRRGKLKILKKWEVENEKFKM